MTWNRCCEDGARTMSSRDLKLKAEKCSGDAISLKRVFIERTCARFKIDIAWIEMTVCTS